jgi:microcin C transport system substrate-binding protein
MILRSRNPGERLGNSCWETPAVRVSRRVLIGGALAMPFVTSAPRRFAGVSAQAADATWRHGLSLYGEVKYPPGFAHFGYVNPHAPKGGHARQIALGTFDNFNLVVSGVKGALAAAIELTSDTLLTPALDEVSTQYGLLAEGVAYPADFSRAVYRLRPQAKWHDGNPVTAEDVIFSFEAFRQNDPRYAAYYRQVAKLAQTGEHEVTFYFALPGDRELPQIVGQINVLPKHWWEGTDGAGNKRDITATTLVPPLGSGPYRIKEFVAGRSIVYERVKDYWGRELNVNVGQNNFDELRFEYFRDTAIAIEAFKADQVDWRTENGAKDWATAYDFPAIRDGRVIKEEFPIRNRGIMQAFVLNLRRDKFKDPRVREAFNFALDFDAMNKQFFFGQYERIGSFFEGTELAATNLPQGVELQILDGLRDQVPPQVYTMSFQNPVGGSPEAVRANLRHAMRLLREAGYEVRNQVLVNAKTGEPLTVEFLVGAPQYERIVLFYKASLERLGIDATLRTVDQAQYENRVRGFDFDIIIAAWPQTLSPGNEQRAYWGSQAADQPGSRNLAGIKNPAVDTLIDRMISAKTRQELVAATRALDRVLLWNHYVVPQWTYTKERTLRWNRFGKPDHMPEFGAADFPAIWWWDPDRAGRRG